jgi:hypothetical protein
MSWSDVLTSLFGAMLPRSHSNPQSPTSPQSPSAHHSQDSVTHVTPPETQGHISNSDRAALAQCMRNRSRVLRHDPALERYLQQQQPLQQRPLYPGHHERSTASGVQPSRLSPLPAPSTRTSNSEPDFNDMNLYGSTNDADLHPGGPLGRFNPQMPQDILGSNIEKAIEDMFESMLTPLLGSGLFGPFAPPPPYQDRYPGQFPHCDIFTTPQPFGSERNVDDYNDQYSDSVRSGRGIFGGAPSQPSFSSSSSMSSVRTMIRPDGVRETVSTTTQTDSSGRKKTITRRQTSDGKIDETTEMLS